MKSGYLGIDIGSVSLKLIIIDDKINILAKVYLQNKGIIETIQKGLKEIFNQIKDIEIKSVGCTGSGREFIKLLLGADIIKTEILAHTVGTLHYYPNVNTIFDIGGEDCKIITLENSIWKNYIMNNICGAGTGATIENIARALNIKIEDVGDMALQSRTNISFPGKCGVLCQSAVVNRKNKGADNSDIMMGVCRALINNYLTLAKSIELNPPYVYQGMTAKNKALVKALEEQLSHEVIVHPLCEYMGAIGIAILTKEANIKETRFKGFEIKDRNIQSETFICKDCPNRCEVVKIFDGENIIGYIGSRCGKYAKL